MRIDPYPQPHVPGSVEDRLRRCLAEIEATSLMLELDQAAFPRQLAEFLVYKSVAVYHALENSLTAPRYSNIQALEECHVKAVGFVVEGQGVLAFRGTQSLQDFAADVRARKCGAPPRHRGFDQAWSIIRPRVQAWLSGLPADAGLVLTGHSLGGALAILAALDLAEQRRVRAVVTFGAPRVGGVEFQQQYDARLRQVTWRVEYGRDPIARIPPPEFDYRHVGQRIWIDGQYEFQTTAHDASTEDERQALEHDRRRSHGPFVKSYDNSCDWLTSDASPFASLWNGHWLGRATRTALKAGNALFKLGQRELDEHWGVDCYSRSFWINARKTIDLEWPDVAYADQICAARLRLLDADNGTWYVRDPLIGAEFWKLAPRPLLP